MNYIQPKVGIPLRFASFYFILVTENESVTCTVYVILARANAILLKHEIQFVKASFIPLFEDYWYKQFYVDTVAHGSRQYTWQPAKNLY